MQPNILLVVLDTVRAKSCKYHGQERDTTTHIEGLRSEAVSFERAIAPATWTVPSHGAIFTGNYASEVNIHAQNKVLPQEEETIASLLTNHGYSTALLSSNPFLTEGTQLYRGTEYRHTSGMRRTVFEEAFDPAEYVKQREYEQGLAKFRELAGELAAPPSEFIKNILNAAYYKYRTTWATSRRDSERDPNYDDGAEETIEKFLDWAGSVRNPFYACLNFMEAHQPYRHRLDYLPKWADEQDLQELSQSRSEYLQGDAEFSDRNLELLEALYHAEIRYLDRQLETLWSTLQNLGLWDDTLVILTSDHGEYLGEHDLIFHHHNRLSDPIIHVPLLVKYPGGEHSGTTVSKPVDLTQIFDTILDAIGESEGTDSPLRPGVDPGLVKSEYVCKEPKNSTEGFLEKYEGIDTPSRAVFDGDKKYLFFEGSELVYVSEQLEDDGSLETFEEIAIDEVPEEVVEFAGLDTSIGGGESLDVTKSIEDRLEKLGYK